MKKLLAFAACFLFLLSIMDAEARTRGQTIAGQLIYTDGTTILYGIGEDIVMDIDDFTTAAFTDTSGITTTDTSRILAGYDVTSVSAGTGNSTVQAVDTVGGIIQLNAAANDNDGVQIQRLNASFAADSANGLYLWFSTRIKFDEATQSDFLVGLCSAADGTLIGGVADGIYFVKADGSTTLNGTVESNTVAANNSYGTALASGTWYDLDFVFRDKRVEFFVNGVSIGQQTTGIPIDVLVPSAAWLNGAASAQNEGMMIDYMRTISIIDR